MVVMNKWIGLFTTFFRNENVYCNVDTKTIVSSAWLIELQMLRELCVI